MNLHPEAQAKMTEFLAMLVKAGLRVLITTHTPYMLDHLSNLIRAAAEYDEEDQKLRDRHGTDRWLRQTSQQSAGKLAEQITEYSSILKSADSSDSLIKEKIEMQEPVLRIMQDEVGVS